jgi:hypothetical protein
MNIVREDLYLSNLACMFLEVRHQLTRADLPYSYLTLKATGANKFVIVT